MQSIGNMTVTYLINVCSLSTSGSKSAPDLEGVVDDPLHAGEGTNHENSCSETLPETIESNVLVDFSSTLSSLIHNGDHGISWVRNDSAEYTCRVTRGEGNSKLGGFAVFILWLSEDVGVEKLYEFLKGNELDDGIWDLSEPKWLNTSVETVESFGRVDKIESFD